MEFSIATGLILPLIQPTLNSLGGLIGQLIQMLDYMNRGYLPLNIGSNISYNFNFVNEIKFGLYIAITWVPFFVLRKAKKGTIVLIYMTLQIVLSIFLFGDVLKFVFFLAVLLFCISSFIPFGSGAYFNIVKYTSYIPNIYQPSMEKKKKLIMPMIIKMAFGSMAFILVLKWLVPFFTAYMLGLLFVTLIFLIWINNSKSKVQIIIRKIVMYSLIIPFVLLSNNIFKEDIQSTVLVLVSIFFAIDRVVVLFKELKKIIEENSLLFLIDEIEDREKLWTDKITFPEGEYIEIPEQMLLRQIIIYFKLNISTVNKLIRLYKDSEYTEQLYLVNAIEYFCVIDEETPIEEREVLLLQILENKYEGIEFIPLLEEYSLVLFYLEKGYNEIVQMLIEHWLYLSDETKYILYYACKQINDLEAAETIKREITDFNNIESEMNERCQSA